MQFRYDRNSGILPNFQNRIVFFHHINCIHELETAISDWNPIWRKWISTIFYYIRNIELLLDELLHVVQCVGDTKSS